MTTKQRFRGKYRLEVREHDHNPMHVHLEGGEIRVTISLETLDVTEGTAPKSLLKEVLDWVTAHHDELVEEWNKWPKQ